MRLSWADPIVASGDPFWPSRTAQAEWPALCSDLRTDVVIIGAGITGALVAHALASQGVSAVVLDKAQPGSGSTRASTALISYEFDLGLSDLAKLHGLKQAVNAYTWCRDGVDDLMDLVQRFEEPCDYAPKRSLRLTRRIRDLAEFEYESELRAQHDLPVDQLDELQVHKQFGLVARGGLASDHAAQIDPLKLNHRLLRDAERMGCRVFGDTRVTQLGQSWVKTSGGAKVTAKRVIFATGYESERFLGKRVGRLTTDFCFVSRPTDVGRTANCHFVENREFYLYASTFQDRILVGLEARSLFSPKERFMALAQMKEDLSRRLSEYLPGIRIAPQQVWGATFAKSKDSLPFLDTLPDNPNALFVLGYGGNGIASSAMLAPFAAAWVASGKLPDEFRFSR